MATIGEVNAKGTDTELKGEVEGLPYMLYFGVFFDGTSTFIYDGHTDGSQE